MFLVITSVDWACVLFALMCFLCLGFMIVAFKQTIKAENRRKELLKLIETIQTPEDWIRVANEVLVFGETKWMSTQVKNNIDVGALCFRLILKAEIILKQQIQIHGANKNDPGGMGSES